MDGKQSSDEDLSRQPARQSMLGRALSILDAFDGASPYLSLNELAQRTDVPKATVFRLATALVERGYLAHGEHGFSLGDHLFMLGQQVHSFQTLRFIARPHLEVLFEVVREHTILLVMRDDASSTIYLDHLRDSRSRRAHPRPVPRPPYATGGGKALLAWGPPRWLADTCSRPMQAITSRTITDPRALARNLERAREAGFSMSVEEFRMGAVSLGAPVVDSRGYAIAAVSVIGDTRLRVDSIAPALRTAALTISRALGLGSN